MPDFEITAPDGRKFIVTAPDGATQDQVLAYVQREAGKPQPSPNLSPATAGGSLAMGAGDLVHGGAQLLTHSLPDGVVGAVNDATAWVNRQPVIGPVTRALGMVPATAADIDRNVAQREVDYQASRRMASRQGGEPGIDWWRMGGQAAATVPLAAALPAAATLPGAVVAGGTSGAATSALMPVTEPEGDYWAQKGRQVAIGGATGAASGAAGHALGRLIAPQASEEARVLAREGVELTPGQAAGGWVQRLEDKATSVPVLGDHIAHAQQRSVESFNRSVANRVLQPLGQTVRQDAPVGRELVADVQQRISQAYDRAISQARPFGPDQQFSQDMMGIARQFLTPDSLRTFEARMRNDIMARAQGGQITPETYQTIRSTLGTWARRYQGSSNAAEQELGEAFEAARQAFDGLLARSNPQIAPHLVRANAAYARLVRMETAASSQAATNGVFTPRQFSAAVRAGDSTLRRRGYAAGDALMQDLSDAGRAVLPQTIPNSGTADRLMLPLLAGGGYAGVSPWLLAPAAAAYGAYTRPVSNALVGFMTREPSQMQRMIGNALATAGRSAAPALSTAAGLP